MPTVTRIESFRPDHQEFRDDRTTLEFLCKYVAPPRLPHGFSGLFVRGDEHHAFHVQSTVEQTDNRSAVYRITTSLDTALNKVVVNSLHLAPADVDFLTSENGLDLTEHEQAPSIRIKFKLPFITPPKVVVFFNLLHIDSQLQARCRISATASEVDAEGFLLTIKSSADTILGRAQACWIAYPADREHIFSASLDTDLPHTETVGDIIYNQPIDFPNDAAFWKIPSVFVALHMLDFKWSGFLRVNAYVDGVTMRNLKCLVETRSDGHNLLRSVGVTLIAVN